MQDMDLNLIPALRILLDEQSVTRAAARLHLSIPATSRLLDRARRTFDDPLLVRRGRGVVMTPAAEALRPRLGDIVSSIERLLERPASFDPSTVHARFVIRCNEAVTAAIGGNLIRLVHADAPHVELRFHNEAADDIAALQTGAADLAIGSYSETASDIDTQFLTSEGLVGIVRTGHPALARRITLRAFARLDHVVVSRRGNRNNPVDRHLHEHGLTRTILAVVPTYAAALAMVATSDLTTIAPRRLAAALAGAAGLHTFTLPTPDAEVAIDQLWHLRYRHDPAHRWLRSCVIRTGPDG